MDVFFLDNGPKVDDFRICFRTTYRSTKKFEIPKKSARFIPEIKSDEDRLPENKDVPSCPLCINVPNSRNKLQQLDNQSLNVRTQASNQTQASTTPNNFVNHRDK
ncbi:hypothetical protein CEXT_758681 [Caerostris extrusa]|uniref:Uncharacterized protein n=1 Tax=Caerostris extrusa TaxID=172846 RepID=A0AAV4X7B5_CAEEX|nr:hypothetical protein CEXT_758681 [Caerostris extrusa]